MFIFLKRKLKLFMILPILSKLIQVKKIETQSEKELFTKIWYRIWLEEKYAEANDKSILIKYARYDPFSIDLLIKFLAIFPIGTVRIIKDNKEVGLPVLNDFEIEKIWKTKKIAEITLFTIIKQFRKFRHLVSLTVIKKIYDYVKKEKIEGIVIAGDRRLFFLLTTFFGFPFHQIGQEKLYEGSLTYPAYLDFEEAKSVLRIKNPQLFEFFEGKTSNPNRDNNFSQK